MVHTIFVLLAGSMVVLPPAVSMGGIIVSRLPHFQQHAIASDTTARTLQANWPLHSRYRR